MQRQIFSASALVLGNVSLDDRYFKLKVSVDKKCFENAQPGHFVQVLCSDEVSIRKNRVFDSYGELKNYLRSNQDRLKESLILMRRPLCIHDAYEEKKDGESVYVFELLVQIKRGGTQKLSKFSPGDNLNIMAPLGRPFDYKKSVKANNDVIIVAGGMGIAPMAFLSRKLIENGVRPTIFFGYEEHFSLKHGSAMEADLRDISKDFIIASNMLEEKCYEKGFVTDVLRRALERKNSDELKKTDIYACGPHLMLKCVKALTDKFDVSCEMSLEEHMGCGVGACSVCVCKTKKGDGFEYKKVCLNGPVFNSKEIIFD